MTSISERVRPGQTWMQKRYDYHGRRVVIVTGVDNRYVNGIGCPQTKYNGEWVDEDWPGARRKTRVLLERFLQGYQLLEAPNADHL